MVEVTQEDRQAAIKIFVMIFGNGHSATHALTDADRHFMFDELARHRQRGKLEGARLAIEAVLPEVVTDRTIDAHGAHCRCTTCELNIAEDGIRALSPAKIVGEG